MEYSKAFISAYQIVEYLVCEHNYSKSCESQKKSMKYGWQIQSTNRHSVIHVIYEKDDDASWDSYVHPVFMMLYSLIQKQGEPLELSTIDNHMVMQLL